MKVQNEKDYSNELKKSFDDENGDENEEFSDNEEEDINEDEDDDDLEDNLIDAEALNKFRRLQESPNKQSRGRRDKSESGQFVGASSSQESLGNESDAARSEKIDLYDANNQTLPKYSLERNLQPK